MQSRDIFFEDDLHKLHQRGNDQNEHDGLQIAEAVGVKQQLLNRPGHSCSQHHNEDNRNGHAGGRIKLLGNAQKRAYAEEFSERVVIHQNAAQKNNC